MSRRRVTMVLAIMAALAGAPSSVSAAPPNQLSGASVAPSSGGSATVFVVSVRYVSPGGNPALAITASGGGQVAVLTLISGTATDGVWRGSTTLPPGSWEVTVQANVAKGASPSLAAGTVSVGNTADEPSPSGDEAPSFGPGPGGGGATSSPPLPQPAATPAAAAKASQAPARSSTAAAPSQPPTGAASGGAAPARPGRSGDAPARSPGAKPSGSGDSAQRSPVASATAGVAPAPGRDDGGLGLFMVMGTLAVGVVALVGSAWVILAGRRDRRAATVSESVGTDPGVSAAAIVDQRALRRARLRSTDDPILAAMGLPDDRATPDPVPPSRAKKTRGRSRRRRPAR